MRSHMYKSLSRMLIVMHECIIIPLDVQSGFRNFEMCIKKKEEKKKKWQMHIQYVAIG